MVKLSIRQIALIALAAIALSALYYKSQAVDFDRHERTVQTLLKGGSDPVISGPPVGAWTHAITDKAL